MPKAETKLHAVAARVQSAEEAHARLKAEADAWVKSQMKAEDKAVEDAVMDALDDGHSIAAVARAYTISGLTPNRNKIYEIKKRRAERITDWVGEYPFRWSPRIVKTRDGERTVYDIVSETSEFGPEDITGEFTWRYDRETNTPEPILYVDRDPYPTSVYYNTVLTKWLADHPYPEED